MPKNNSNLYEFGDLLVEFDDYINKNKVEKGGLGFSIYVNKSTAGKKIKGKKYLFFNKKSALELAKLINKIIKS